jgi:hypothetical protein
MIANSFRLMASRPQTSLVTDRALAHSLQVSARMIRLWVDTGAWPLPRCVRRTMFHFDVSDVERWLKTGVWPTGARFRLHVRPRQKACPACAIRRNIPSRTGVAPTANVE